MNYPNLHNEQIIGIDLETYDPDLITNGPGWPTRHGYVVGISVATLAAKWYFPLRHKFEAYDNVEIEPTLRQLKSILENPAIAKVGTNIMYDIGWLSTEDIQVKGTLHDIQFAEALIDTNACGYGLDPIAERYLKIGKTSNKLYQWLADKYGGNPDGSQRANLYRSPPRLAKPYAEDDAQLPLRILVKQATVLERRGLEDVYKLECDLIPLLIAMRKRGLSVDMMRAEEARENLMTIEKVYRKQLDSIAGFHVGVNTKNDLKKLFDDIGLQYPYTKQGNPSFTKTWLSAQEHPTAQLVSDIRGVSKARNDFIEKAILERAHNGKIYPSLHPLRSDEGGTITGRFSCSNPNCHSSETEVLTKNGWKFFPDVVNDDMLAQYDIVSNELSWDKPIELISGIADNLYVFYSNKLSFEITENHRCLIIDKVTKEKKFVTADVLANIGRGNKTILRAGNLYGGKSESIPQIKFVVATSADGSLRDNSLRFGFNKARKALRLQLLLDECNLDNHVYDKGDGYSPRYCLNMQAPKWLFNWIEKDGTTFRNNLLHISYECRQVFLDEIILWDGHNRKHLSSAYYSFISSNRSLVHAIACITGYCGVENAAKKYVTLQKNKPHVYVERLQHSKVYGKQHVYCATMPKGTLFTRLNGKSLISGNSQQIPSRDSFLAPIIRGIFIPERGYSHWCKMDHSQIEYRCFAHYAHKYLKDDVLVKAYEDPHTDYHAVVGNILGGKIPRTAVKNINFGSLYGMGIDKTTRMFRELFTTKEAFKVLTDLGVTPGNRNVYDTLAITVRRIYAKKFPQAGNLMKHITHIVESKSMITTISGRRTPFNLFEPYNNREHRAKALPYKQALQLYGHNIKVADAYKGLNYTLQGSAADVLKMGLRDVWNSGIFDRIGVPHILVHDELDISVVPDMKEDIKEVKRIMENAVQLAVPIIMDIEIGENWGNVGKWK
ncbi:MAG: DNA polymerase [Pseudomonadota bacterium]|nr:DNA polymerase [Pseudomonadota bacterium]